MDVLAGGAWLGLNDFGLIAGVLNRRGSLGPHPDKRSRGELPLEALDHAEAVEAAKALAQIEPASYRPFNLVIADRGHAFCLRSVEGDGKKSNHHGVEIKEIPPGLSMVTAYDMNDLDCPRIRMYLPQFKALDPPEPAKGDFSSWQTLMKSRLSDAGAGPEGAMNVVTENGFCTVSSSFIALQDTKRADSKPIWLHTSANPAQTPYETISL